MTTNDWRRSAECLGVKLDFFNLIESNKVKLRATCASCKVNAECLEFTMFQPQSDGMWAGVTPDERIELRKAHPDYREVREA